MWTAIGLCAVACVSIVGLVGYFAHRAGEPRRRYQAALEAWGKAMDERKELGEQVKAEADKEKPDEVVFRELSDQYRAANERVRALWIDVDDLRPRH